MKHLKLYDNYNGFKVGDIVEIRDRIDYNIGEITRIIGDEACIDTLNGDDDQFAFIDYLKLAAKPNAERFKMKRDAKKFNL